GDTVHRAVEQRDLELGAEGGFREGDRLAHDEVVALALEPLVRSHVDVDVEVSGGTALGAGHALPRDAQAVTAVDAGGEAHRHLALLLDPAGAVAVAAGRVDRLPRAAARAAALGEHDEPARGGHLSTAAAGTAGGHRAAVLGAGAATALALHRGVQIDLLLAAEHRLLERETLVDAQIAPALGTAAAALAAEAAHSEEVAEEILEVREDVGAAEVGRPVEPGVAEAVVPGALLLVAEDLVGLGHGLELGGGVAAAPVAIGVMLERQLLVRLADVCRG